MNRDKHENNWKENIWVIEWNPQIEDIHVTSLRDSIQLNLSQALAYQRDREFLNGYMIIGAVSQNEDPIEIATELEDLLFCQKPRGH